jgi:AAA+ superfamily predicted ATPase
MLSPEDVFTPAKPVSTDMFATRRHERLQDRVEEALNEPGRQVVLYGDTGVGKTSLIMYLAAQRGISMLRVECGPSFEEMMRDALGRVVGETEIEKVRKDVKTAEFGVGLVNFLNAKASRSAGEDVKFAKYPRSVGGLVAETLSLLGYRVIFLDNFENINGKLYAEETIRAIAELLKLLSDRGGTPKNEVKAVVAGIPSAAEELVVLDAPTARRTAQIEVGRMPADELTQILDRGAKKLALAFDPLCSHRIVAASDGFPYYTHLHALHASRTVIEAQRRHVTLEDFETSLDEILNDCDLALKKAYTAAVETTGVVRVRKSILEAVATITHPDVSFREIRESFLKLHPEYGQPAKLNFLSTAIKPLKETYGILEDSGRPRSKKNLYRFTNPLMRGYVLLRREREQRDKNQEPLPLN